MPELTVEEREAIRQTWDFGPWTEADTFHAVVRIIAAREAKARAEGAAAVVAAVAAIPTRHAWVDDSLGAPANMPVVIVRDLRAALSTDTDAALARVRWDWTTVPHTHGGTDCGGGDGCPAHARADAVDAWRDEDGDLWLNLRKHPDGWPGVYDADTGSVPLYLQPVPTDAALPTDTDTALARVRAEALRDAADEMPLLRAADWLRARADAVEGGTP